MLHQRFVYDKKEAVNLNKFQIATRNNILAKIESNIYQMEETQCICGNNNYEVLAKKDKYGLPVRTVICKNCGLVYTNPRMTMESYNTFYQNEYRKLYNKEVIPFKFYQYQVARGQYIIEFLKSNKVNFNGKVLEIGCGAGGILEVFKKEGCDVTGIDLGEEYINYGRKKGINLLTGTSKDLLKNHMESFDLIILSHVLEHFLNINEELAIIYKLLKETGFLYLEVPGLKSLRNNLDFLLYLQNAHTYHFTLDTLNQVLKSNGFDLIIGDKGIHSIFKKGAFVNDFENYYEDIKNYLYSLEYSNEFYRQKYELERKQKMEEIRLRRFLEIQERIKKYSDSSVALYGTGAHTQLLLSFLRDNKQIYGLIDDDIKKCGQTLLGYSIYKLDQVIGQIKAVVISSYDYQETIYERIKKDFNKKIEVLKIYKECDYYQW